VEQHPAPHPCIRRIRLHLDEPVDSPERVAELAPLEVVGGYIFQSFRVEITRSTLAFIRADEVVESAVVFKLEVVGAEFKHAHKAPVVSARKSDGVVQMAQV